MMKRKFAALHMALFLAALPVVFVCLMTTCRIVFADDDKPQVKATESPGARILTWMPGDATDKLIGKRDRYIGDAGPEPTMYLFIAISDAEFEAIEESLYADLDHGFGWPFISAQKDGFLVAVKYARQPHHFLALRADKFLAHKDKIEAVHKGNLPDEVLRIKPKPADVKTRPPGDVLFEGKPKRKD